MEEIEIRNPNFKFEHLGIIDVLSEDDCLLGSHFVESIINEFPGNQNMVPEFMDNVHRRNGETSVSSFKEKEKVLQLHESREYGFGERLACANALVTSTGFLDTKKLSGMIESNVKSEKHVLHVIQDDISRSTGFCKDIRALDRNSGNTSTTAISKGRKISRLPGSATTHSSNKMNVVPREKMKPKVALKKPSTQRSENSAKQVSVHPQALQTVAAKRELTSSACNPPNVLSRVQPFPTTSLKRVSLDVSRVKIGNGAKNSPAAPSRMAPMLITPALASPRGTIPRNLPLVKSSLRSPAAATKEMTSSCSSLDSCVTTSSDSIRKSSGNLIRKKTDTRSVCPSSSSIARTPSRVASGRKTEPGNLQVFKNPTSETKLPCSTSPASSISEWSSEGSTISTVFRKDDHSTRNHMETCFNGTISRDNDSPKILNSKNHPNDQSAEHGVQVTGLPGENGKRVSSGTSGLARPASFKLSGLRAPSPKVGFFNGAKKIVPKSDGKMQSRPPAPSGLAKQGTVANKKKHGTSNPRLSGVSTTTKSGKIQSTRALTAILGTKLDVLQTTRKGKLESPLPLQVSSYSATMISSNSRNVKSASGSSIKVQRISPKTPSEKHMENVAKKPQLSDRTKTDKRYGLPDKSKTSRLN